MKMCTIFSYLFVWKWTLNPTKEYTWGKNDDEAMQPDQKYFVDLESTKF